MAEAGLMWRWWTCRRLRAQLVDFDSEAMDPAARAGIESHLADCERCSAGLAALREVPAMLRVPDGSAPAEVFWRSQRQAIMGTIRSLPVPASAAASTSRRSLVARPGWMTWAPALVAATVVLALVALRSETMWRALHRAPSAEVDGLDDPTLLSLSDLAGMSSPDVGPSAGLVHDEGALPELSDDELDALAQLVGVRG
jgi:hypothetical protein